MTLIEDDAIAREAADALRLALGDRLVAVVLFGSRARGDAKPESDWDLLVIAEGLPEHPLERHLLLKQALPVLIRSRVSILAKTRAEFEAHFPALYLDIGLDGRVLVDPSGYFATRQAMVRGIIRRAGLHRERSTAGDAWVWDHPPSGHWSLHWDS